MALETFHPRFGVSTITGGTIPFQKDLSPSCLYIFTMQSHTWKVSGVCGKGVKWKYHPFVVAWVSWNSVALQLESGLHQVERVHQ